MVAMKTVTYRSAAVRALRKLPPKVQTRIVTALTAYAGTGKGDLRKLTNVKGARLRIGDYRAIFIETSHEIEVIAIGHRKDIYR